MEEDKVERVREGEHLPPTMSIPDSLISLCMGEDTTAPEEKVNVLMLQGEAKERGRGRGALCSLSDPQCSDTAFPFRSSSRGSPVLSRPAVRMSLL